MRVTITDDFDLEKIAKSGQCFRVRKFEGGENGCAPTYQFITREHVLYIRRAESADSKEYDEGAGAEGLSTEEGAGTNLSVHAEVGLSAEEGAGAGEYFVSCTANDWKNVWAPYFDLNRNYAKIRASIPKSDEFMRKAAYLGRGIRILKQDAWEMLITFIISQRKSIPAIQKSVELLCEMFGSAAAVSSNHRHSAPRLFPTPAQLQAASPEDLKACKLGYRAPYVQDATRAVCSGELDLDALERADDENLTCALKQVRGVGDKVANCISLFAYARTSLAPVDTWIKKIIDLEYGGKNPFIHYDNVAGIMQQYAFWWAQQNKNQF